MGELIDKVKGRIKELAGVALGDRSMEAEGKGRQAVGKVKGDFEEAKQGVKEAMRKEPPRH